MDYKEKYENLIEKLKKAKEGQGGYTFSSVVDNILQELHEIDGERVRNAIINLVKQSSEILDKSNQKRMLDWLEKQGEQKPTDKVEPKFKVGDWVTNGEYTWKVTDIKSLDYILQSPNGDVVDDTISYVDEYFHLWAIEDAKDGDVLAAYECYVIFKEIDDLNIKCYCTYHYMNNPMFFVNTLQNKTAFYPAAKEQRDILFQKVRESGYEWNAEKKELKKIDSYCQKNCKGYQETGRCFADGECQAKKDAVSTWSEEDEKMLSFIDAILEYAYNNNSRGFGISCIDLKMWLKSLKPQQNQYDKGYNDGYSAAKYNHWKPSEEQLEALWDIIPHIPNSEKDIDTITELSALYEELKKL